MKGTEDVVLTHCPYSALNCGLGLEVDAVDGALDRAGSLEGLPADRRRRCARRASTAWEQVHHADRL